MKNFILTFLNSSIGGFLGAFAGADKTSKNWRRYCIPGLIISNAYNYTQNLWVLLIGIMIGILSLGYGIPDSTDEGSTLGKFWYKIGTRIGLGGSVIALFSNLCTRGTISIGLVFSLLILPLIKGNWVIYGWGSLIFIIIFITLSWRDLGQFTLLKKKLLWCDFIVYFTLVILSLILIYL